ncbi:MAG: invasion associated locus B family protein [Kiloniellales bacterium]
MLLGFMTAGGLNVPDAAAQDTAAKPNDGKVFQDWRVRCADDAHNLAAGGCFIFQSVVNNETQQPVMQLVVGRLAEDNQPAAVITLPLGIRVAPGVLMQIDQNEAVRLPFERCLPDGCKVQFRIDENQMAAFKSGVGGKLAFQDAQGRNITLPFSLKGFTAAFASLQ